MSYYGQAVKGHWQITRGKKDIDLLLKDPQVDPQLKERLRTVQSIRQFALDDLMLPDSGSYTDYVDLKRDVTLWLLSAAPKYSLAPRSWCYLFVGCFNYRGYFSRAQADAEADRLAALGFDVVLAPGLAYSTLGFSNDPVLSTMLRYSDPQLAGVLFHELAHERLYVRNDSAFNESFATAVETLGRERWVQSLKHPMETGGNLQDPRQGPAVSAAQRQAESTKLRRRFDDLVVDVRRQLEALYESENADCDLAAGKQAIFAQFRQRHDALMAQSGGRSPIDHWFEGDGPNNARIALYSTYELEVPAFLQMFRECNQQLECFYAAAEQLAKQAPETRNAHLQALSERAAAIACPGETCEGSPALGR